MIPVPFAITRQPGTQSRAYLLHLPGQPPQIHRRKRDALSHAIQANRVAALLR